MTADPLAALIIGLLGSTHCMGMCGGIASLLSLNKPNRPILVPVLYNLGRIISYMLFGALIGSTVSSIAEISSTNHILTWLRLVAAIFMVLLALYIGNWWKGLLFLEKLGGHLWVLISPIARSMLPIRKPIYALPCGFIWGWLPCGLVYSVLTWAAISGGALNGALVMLFFGLGTLPAMIAVGYSSAFLSKIQQSNVIRQTAAIMIFSYAIYTGYTVLNLLLLR